MKARYWIPIVGSWHISRKKMHKMGPLWTFYHAAWYFIIFLITIALIFTVIMGFVDKIS